MTNFFVNNLIATFDERNKTSPSDAVNCDICTENIATLRCVDCPQFNCDKCIAAHQKYPALRTHRILTIEEFRQGAKSATPTFVQPVERCSVHHDNPLKYYCDTCEVAVCSECAIVDHRVPDHKHRYIQEVFDECKTELTPLMVKLKEKGGGMDDRRSRAVKRRTSFKHELQAVDQKVTVKAEEVRDKTSKEEQRLKDELKQQYTSKMKSIDVEIYEVELIHGNIKSTYNYIETLMNHGSPVQLLTSRRQILDRIRELIAMETTVREYEKVDFQPTDGFQEHGMLGVLRSDICISECTVENIPKELVKGDQADLSITTRDSTGRQVIPLQEVTAKVRKPDGSQHVAMVTDNKDGTHKVTVKGDMSGQHRVTMVIGDQPIPGSPCDIPVIQGLVKTIGKKGSGDLEFDEPRSVTIDKDGNFVTADTDNNRLQVTSKSGGFKKVMAFTQFNEKFSPRDIAISSNNEYFSTDYYNKQVIISDVNGRVVKCFGKAELQGPVGIAISTDPQNRIVYVVDDNADCIRMYRYDSTYQYIGSFGSHGSGPGQFNGPFYIVISQGTLFITDCGNHRVQVFTTSGQFLYTFGQQGTKDGQLNCPRGIAVDQYGYAYVSSDHRLQKFDRGGKFVCRIDSDKDGLSKPYNIALTDDDPCRIVVANCWGDSVKVFV